MDRIEYDLSTAIGLGGLIGFYSLILSTKQPAQINIQPGWTLVHDIKRIFNIADDRVVINEVHGRSIDNALVDTLGDNAKFFSSYIKTDQLNLFGQNMPVLTRSTMAGTALSNGKPCIGFAIGGSTEIARWKYLDRFSGLDPEMLPKKYPYTKQHIDKIIELCIDSGYDIVTINSDRISLEHKILLLNNLCDCVVGYEGGMAHLAHCLDIPVIMFPWENDHTKHAMMMHLDKKTYFLNSADEVLGWTPDIFLEIKDRLHNNLGNNEFLTDQFKNSSTDEQMNYAPDGLRDFLKNNIEQLTIGGYNE